jgi:hypothetical protein
VSKACLSETGAGADEVVKVLMGGQSLSVSMMRISASRSRTTSPPGSMRMAFFALHGLELLVHALARGAQQLRQFFLRQLQADAHFAAVDRLGTP